MKIALTGALGIVGTFTTRYLRTLGHDLVRIDMREARDDEDPSDLLRVDLTSFDATRAALDGVDRVVHLAGMNSPRAATEWTVYNNNVTSSYNVLSAAAELGVPRVVQASSVNAIGLSWSRTPTFDYFPIDLAHPTRNEDGYSLSKLAQEQQADSLTRRHESFSVASLRLHAVIEDASQALPRIERFGESWAVNGLFGYCTHDSVASAIALATEAPFTGHQVLYVVEPATFSDVPTAELARRHYPHVALRRELVGTESFFDASRTREVLGWVPSTL